MNKTLALSVAAIALAASTPAFAQMDCEREARVMVNKMHSDEAPDITEENTPGAIRVTRFTLLGYDACKAGAHDFARQHFETAQQHLDAMTREKSG